MTVGKRGGKQLSPSLSWKYPLKAIGN